MSDTGKYKFHRATHKIGKDLGCILDSWMKVYKYQVISYAASKIGKECFNVLQDWISPNKDTTILTFNQDVLPELIIELDRRLNPVSMVQAMNYNILRFSSGCYNLGYVI